MARTCHAEEVARRGLAEGPPQDEDSAESLPAAVAAPQEELICIVEYDYADEADLAHGLLNAAEIPAVLESEPGVVRLMVPATLAEQALRMLAAPLSDEELAAQAEAAGLEGEQAEEELEEDPDA